jgi:hypothetical protein
MIAHHQVVDFVYRSCGAVFKRKYAVSAQPVFNRREYAVPGQKILMFGIANSFSQASWA